MKIERYIAQDTKTAMAQVRAELGPDALILANRRMGDRIEITAGIDIDDWVDQQARSSRTVAHPAARSATAVPAALSPNFAQSQPATSALGGDAPVNEIQLKALERELQRLRGILEHELGDRQWRDTTGMQAPLAALRQRLLRLGLSRTLTGELMRGLEQQPAGRKLEPAWQHVLGLMASCIQVYADAGSMFDTERHRAVAVFGTTGVGKTSAIAKLAGRDIQQFGVDSVALISLDSYRLGAKEQLTSFANAMGLPLRCANDRHDLSVAMREFAGRRVYIDTAGMGQHDPRLTQQLALVDRLSQPVTRLLVLSASAQPAQSRAVSALFAKAAVSGTIITKIDEAHSLGGVLDVIIRGALPVHSITDGQRVPEDIHRPDAGNLVHRAIELQGQDNTGAAAVASASASATNLAQVLRASA